MPEPKMDLDALVPMLREIDHQVGPKRVAAVFVFGNEGVGMVSKLNHKELLRRLMHWCAERLIEEADDEPAHRDIEVKIPEA